MRLIGAPGMVGVVKMEELNATVIQTVHSVLRIVLAGRDQVIKDYSPALNKQNLNLF